MVHLCAYVCVCVCARAHVCVCVCVCVRARARACVRVRVHLLRLLSSFLHVVVYSVNNASLVNNEHLHTPSPMHRHHA
jgi:hypothetical protein